MKLFEVFIPGRPPSKKNTKKVVRRHGQTFVIYSPQFKEWEKDALLILKKSYTDLNPIDQPLIIHLVFTFENKRSEADVSNLIEAPQDALTKAGVISDDRIIQVVQAKKEFAKTAGTLIQLWSIEDT